MVNGVGADDRRATCQPLAQPLTSVGSPRSALPPRPSPSTRARLWPSTTQYGGPRRSPGGGVMRPGRSVVVDGGVGPGPGGSASAVPVPPPAAEASVSMSTSMPVGSRQRSRAESVPLIDTRGRTE